MNALEVFYTLLYLLEFSWSKAYFPRVDVLAYTVMYYWYIYVSVLILRVQGNLQLVVIIYVLQTFKIWKLC